MFWKKNRIELYSEKEMELLENHISSSFGEIHKVFHEIVSPDIHVDICWIAPTLERNYHTLVTMGMGAHRMAVPRVLRKSNLDRAELIVTLPLDWDIENDDEKYYWPLRWLKMLARLPKDNKTWLGYGHTIQMMNPLPKKPELCSAMITMPYFFGHDAAVCKLPNDVHINFYQIIPLYENEMNYKLENDAEALENLFPDDFNMVVDVARKSVIGN